MDAFIWFSYQGYLSANGTPANGSYDMTFTLFRQGETTPGPSVAIDSVPVTLGVFTVRLDFGQNVFDGTAYELGIAVRPHSSGGGTTFVNLQPRQPLSAAPYAIQSRSVSSVPDSALSANVALLNGTPMFTTPVSMTMLRVANASGGGVLNFGNNPDNLCAISVDPQGPSGLLLRDPSGIRILTPTGSTGQPTLRFGPTDDCSIGIDPAFPGLVERDPIGFRLLGRNNQGCRLIFGPTMDCTVEVNPAGPMGLLLRDPKGIRIWPPNTTDLPRLLFGPTDDCSIGIDPAFPGLVERDPIGFRLLGRTNQGCRLIFGPTMNCTVEVDPAGPAGLLLRDPSGIRIVSPDPQRLPILRFGPTDDCSIGLKNNQSGLIVLDPFGLRIAPTAANALPRLLFGPTDDCSIGIDPALSGLIERDPIGFRLLGPNNQGCRLIFGPTMNCTVEVNPAGPAGLLLRDPSGIRILSPDPQRPPMLRFGPTDDCSIGLNNNQSGLIVLDPFGLRIAPTSGLPRLRFGPTDDCSIGLNTGQSGLIVFDPFGLRIAPASGLPTLRFGPTDDCSIGIDPALTGLLIRDPKGIRIAPPVGSAGQPILRFGPTDDCSIGIDPAFPGLVERDVIGLRLLGQNNQGGRLLFGPTSLCTIEVSNSVPGLFLRDPGGVRLVNPSGQTNRLSFGPTDICVVAADPNGGMRFSDPRGFTFGNQVTVNGPVFAQSFIQTSSRRFKEDIKPIEEPLEKISKLKGVRFTWNEEKGGQKDIGFIAEEVAKVVPELVSWEEDGQNARGVNYDHLVAVAIEGIKAQQTQIQTLEREKAELKQNLESMQSKLDRLSEKLEKLLARD